MLTHEEQKMVADAEHALKLQKAASDRPWLDDDGTIVDELGGVIAFVQPHGNVNTVARTGEHYSKSDAAFIANSRTDPSAANVLTLAKEVERLRGIARRATPQPRYFSAAFTRSYFERVDKELRREHAQQCIDACHIHGVEVPEHLKPYERSEP